MTVVVMSIEERHPPSRLGGHISPDWVHDAQWLGALLAISKGSLALLGMTLGAMLHFDYVVNDELQNKSFRCLLNGLGVQWQTVRAKGAVYSSFRSFIMIGRGRM